MWQRFTEAARRAVYYAQIEAQTDNVNQVTPEHLLIGLLREPEARSYRIAAGCGANPDAVVAALRTPPLPRNPWATTDTPRGKEMTLSARAKRAIDF
ncbi:MAG: Clp protease N-terminal domain-containing protein [Armatimonadetes bacterium]|nr:Clp protease N-terminal domain-containing protein [Armatimonadota bacterium]